MACSAARANGTLACLLGAALAACGGGGGDNGGGNTVPPPGPTPSPPPFDVEGVVSGLAGRGFAIQNSAVVLPIEANGRFGFSGLSNGARFEVTVVSQPMAPSQTCAIANGVGSFLGPPITNLEITCTNDELAVLAGRIGGQGFRDDAGAFARFASPTGITAAADGTLYVTDLFRVRRVTPQGVVTTLAGGIQPGSADGAGDAARFAGPLGIAADSSGALYVADTLNHVIRRITPSGVVTTFAGNPAVAGSADGTGSDASFVEPSGIAVDGAGNVYVTDRVSHTIRKITPERIVTTLAGIASLIGSADGVGSAATFNTPHGVAVDDEGYVYVADRRNHTVRKISPSGEVTTLAGVAGESGFVDGAGAAARFADPYGLALGTNGRLYVTEYGGGGHLRTVATATGVVTYVAGGGGFPEGVDGVRFNANFGPFAGVAGAPDGTVYIADWANGTLRKVIGDVVTTLAGMRGQTGDTDGEPWAVRFRHAGSVAAAPDGTLFVADRAKIRTVSSTGYASTLTGGTEGGTADGPAGQARFGGNSYLALAANGTLYVADAANHTVRAVAPDGAVTTLVGLAGVPGYADGAGSEARFEFLAGIAVDPIGNLYVSEHNRRVVRKITPSGVVSLFAGSPDSPGRVDGVGSAARFTLPSGLATDSSGYVYVADSQAVRRISPTGEVVTLAGGNLDERSDGVGAAAGFRALGSLTLDAAGNVYVVDGARLRKVTPAGFVTTIAGAWGQAGVRPGPLPGSLNAPRGIAVVSTAPLTLAVTDENAVIVMPVPP